MYNIDQANAPTDFDFIIGDWQVQHRRLKSRLSGCTQWIEFSGHSSTRKIMGGYGNVEDNILCFPEGDVLAAAFRSYSPETNTWAIWWLDRRNPHHLDVPVVGHFCDQVGIFHAHDILDNVSVMVRFIWTVNEDGSPTWEQAFSTDDGANWETNWIMAFSRVDI